MWIGVTMVWLRVAKSLALISSNNDHEVLAGARGALRVLDGQRMTIHDLVERLRQPAENAFFSDAERSRLTREAALAKREAEQAKREAEAAQREVERAKLDVELAKREAEQAKREAERLKTVSQLKKVSERRAIIIALLRDPANAGRSNRNVAAAVGVSPQTVGNLRRQIGIEAAARTVTRRGPGGRPQTYQMRSSGGAP
jgi:multidrug resistance efflux pump